jgi:hypothetical protein
VNKHIVAAALIIGATGVIKAYSSNPPKAITPVIIGTYVLLLLLALMDLFGGPLAALSSALAMLAVLYILLTEFPWDIILHLVKKT